MNTYHLARRHALANARASLKKDGWDIPNDALVRAIDVAISIYNIEIESDAPFTPAPERKPTPVEALAERLAKVEDRIAGMVSSYGSSLPRLAKVEDRLAAFGKELHGVNIGEAEHYAKVHERIDKVAEIIGERVSGLVDDITAIRDLLGEHGPRSNADVISYAGRLGQLADAVRNLDPGWRGWKGTDGPAFPTGGASTAEAATDAVLPVPQRGDRVLIKDGSQTLGGVVYKEQWATVIGVSGSDMVQVELDGEGETRSIPWLDIGFIKEVMHREH